MYKNNNLNFIDNIDLSYLDTENKYYVNFGSKRAYVDERVGLILLGLKKKDSIVTITERLNNNYGTNLTSNQTIEFIEKKIIPLGEIDLKKSNLRKVFKILNPSKLPIERVTKIINEKFFFSFFYWLLFFNFALFVRSSSAQNLTINERIIVIVSIFLLLIGHELGHVIGSEKFGIKSEEIGFGLYGFLPVFYTNITPIWRLDRRKRNIVNLSGIYIQLVVGLLLGFTNLFIDSDIILSVFRINVLLVIINLNPFLKFDGYWVLADLLKEPNLFKKSNFRIKEIKFLPIKILVYGILKKLFFISLIGWIFYKTFLIINKIDSSEHISFRVWDGLYVFSSIVIILFTLIRLFKISKNEKHN